MGYAIRITSRAVDVVSGADQTQGTIAAEASGVRVGGLRAKWGGSQLHSRKGSMGTGQRVVRQGNGWVVEGSPGSPYVGTPVSGRPVSGNWSGTPTSSYMGSPATYSPYSASPNLSVPYTNGYSSNPNSAPSSPAPGVGLGLSTPTFGPAPHSAIGTGFPTAATMGSPSPYSPGLPPPPLRTPSGGSGYSMFPPTPNPANGGSVTFAPGPPPKRENPKKDD